ncbi:type II secretion system protein GspM [Sphingomonas sp.]|uniref:type II secretion system protein GspM n=1 Tax=Sphingomonas sp. TaxID=28214 RepID=UPI0035C7A81D
MIAWFNARSLREKRLILAMLALAAVTLVWAAALPLRNAVSSARTRQVDAVVRLGRTLNAVADVRRAQRAGIVPLAGDLASAVRTRAEAAGFALASLDQDGDRVRIAISTAKPGALFRWVAELEAAGVLVDAASITPNADQTVAVQMTLRGRA